MVRSFGHFEFDPQRRRLCSAGRPVKLSGQVVDLLGLLVERPGELITREEIQRRLWPDSTVEFDHSLDVIVSRLRAVLGDRGATPRYIETVPRKGYRFIEAVSAKAEALPPTGRRLWSRRLATYAAVAILAAVVAVLFARTRYDKLTPGHEPRSRPAPRSSEASPDASAAGMRCGRTVSA
jgi:DNA-binding winged helix-turn-helix (wHTH) protein